MKTKKSLILSSIGLLGLSAVIYGEITGNVVQNDNYDCSDDFNSLRMDPLYQHMQVDDVLDRVECDWTGWAYVHSGSWWMPKFAIYVKVNGTVVNSLSSGIGAKTVPPNVSYAYVVTESMLDIADDNVVEFYGYTWGEASPPNSCTESFYMKAIVERTSRGLALKRIVENQQGSGCSALPKP